MHSPILRAYRCRIMSFNPAVVLLVSGRRQATEPHEAGLSIFVQEAPDQDAEDASSRMVGYRP